VRDDEQRFTQTRRLRDEGAEAFIKAVKAVDADGLNVRVEQLMPVTADGRVIDRRASRTTTFVDSFARAASSLSRRGEISEVVETPFGYDVIMLLEVTPEARLSASERLRATRDEIFRARASQMREQLVARLRAEGGVAATGNSDALMAAVDVSGRAAEAQ